jgi:hypothetical protein
MSAEPKRVDKVRDLLARADRHRKIARGADMGRVHIRLGRKPRVEQRRTFRIDTTVFTAEMTTALYEALGIVERDNLALAERYEKEATE